MRFQNKRYGKVIGLVCLAIAGFGISCSGVGTKKVYAEEGIPFDSTSFPDEAFLNRLKEMNIDTNSDGQLSQEELQAVTEIRVRSGDKEDFIYSLEGIQYFTNLETLDCYNNHLSSLDLSTNTKLKFLNCGSNDLTVLDLSTNTELTYLDCMRNEITDLNISQNTNLNHLDCRVNSLDSLDIRKNTELTYLNCSASGNIDSLDLNMNMELDHLECGGINLSSLDVSKNTKLTYLDCNKTNITSLDMSKNAALIHLDCRENNIATLDLSKNKELEWLNVSWNNSLAELDLRENTKLKTLYCNVCSLSNLDLSNQSSLSYLNASDQWVGRILYKDENGYYMDLTGLSLDFTKVSNLESRNGLDLTINSFDLETGKVWFSGLNRERKARFSYDYPTNSPNSEYQMITVHVEEVDFIDLTVETPSTEQTGSTSDVPASTETTIAATEAPVTTASQGTPKTGDMAMPIWVGILGILSAGALVLTGRKGKV